jgi:hypothetical protein
MGSAMKRIMAVSDGRMNQMKVRCLMAQLPAGRAVDGGGEVRRPVPGRYCRKPCSRAAAM